ncbi:MAG: TonB-dependent receptor [Bacteroidetes bacterium]|nr:TonB-dependent receptor [Bacteroidota bacterium]
MKRYTKNMICLAGAVLAGKLATANGSIAGKITDEMNHPVASATVELFNAKDSSLVKVLLTDVNGKYSFDNIAPGRLLLEVDNAGFKSVVKNVDIEDGANADLDIPGMARGISKGIIENDNGLPFLAELNGMMVLTFEGTNAKIGGTTLDILKVAPGISQDEQGRLTLDGSTLFELQKDGKDLDVSAAQMDGALRAIPMKEVASIIINRDPKRNKSESGLPVVNLVTLTGEKLGLYGEVNSNTTFGQVTKNDQGVVLNYNSSKVQVYGSFERADNSSVEKDFMSRILPMDGTNLRFENESITKDKPVTEEAIFGTEYKGAKGFAAGIELNGTQLKSDANVTDVSKYSFDGLDTTFIFPDAYSTHTEQQDASATVHIDQTIRATGTILTAKYAIDHNKSLWNETFPFAGAEGGTHIEATPGFHRYSSANDIGIHNATFEMTQVWTKKLITVAGYNHIAYDNLNTLSMQNLSNGEWVNANGNMNQFKLHEAIGSIYLNTYLDLGKTQFAAGLDAEQVHTTGNSLITDHKFQVDNLQLFPSVNASRTFGKNGSISFKYFQSITRPTMTQLDPFGHYTNQYTYVAGNPNLKPEIGNTAKVSLKMFQVLELTGELNEKHNGIQDVTMVDANGLNVRMPENISNSHNASAGIKCLIPVGNKIALQTSATWTWSHFQTEIYGMNINSRNRKFVGQATMLVTLPANFNLIVDGYYVSPASDGIIATQSTGAVDASITKSMMNDKVILSAGVNDIFKTGTVRATILSPEGNVAYKVIPETQTAFVKATIKVGNEKAKRETNND